MKKQELKWTTTHTDTRMIHYFENGFIIVLDKTINVAYKVDPEYDVIGKFDTTGMLLETYEEKLLEFAAKATKVFETHKMPEPCLN